MEKYLLECYIIYFWTVKGWVKTFAQVIYAVSLMGLIEVKQDLVLTDIDIFSRFYKEIILCEENCISKLWFLKYMFSVHIALM